MAPLEPANESIDVERLSMRELLVLARTRLGAKASTLKTREELEAALRAPAVDAAPRAQPQVKPAAAATPIVVRDFFIRQS